MPPTEYHHPLSASRQAEAAPVLFFFFNRPEYTRRIWDQIRLARPSRLLLVADGPRERVSSDAMLCAQTRAIVEGSIDWPCVVDREYAHTNLGARDRIVSGLAWAFERVDRAIVLEDDCLPSPSFFSFCGELLERFQEDPAVGMIAGTNYRPSPPERGGSSYFGSRHSSIWGWATWRRVVSGYDPQMPAWRSSLAPRHLRQWFTDGRSRLLHTTMFDLAREGGVTTWDIAWCLHMIKQRMISVVPSVNLVSNIGIEGTRGRTDDANNCMPIGQLHFPLRHPLALEPDPDYDRFVACRHRLWRDWMRAKWTHRLRRLMRASA